MVRKVIFSVCVGGYDTIPALRRSFGFEHIMVTDDPDLDCPGWEKLIVPRETSPALQSRRLKLCPHRLIDADLYIYLDANTEVLHDLGPLVQGMFIGGFTAVEHNSRNCIYDEAGAIIKNQRADPEKVQTQVDAYRADGMEPHYGLFSNGFFIRDRSFDAFCEEWYAEVEKHTARDQLSLPYLVWKHRPQIAVMPWATRQHYLRIHPHKGQRKGGQIWYFVPGAGDKDLGSALNRHCEIVPHPDDWICIRDNDTMWAHPYINQQLEDIVAKHGDAYDLLSCYTNRLGLKHQLPYGLMEERDLLKLKALAQEHYDKDYDAVIPSDKPTAGLFMLFRKRTWMEHPFEQGLADNGDFIDFKFANGLLKKGKKIGICTGVFLVHLYRMGKNVRDISHLRISA